MPDREKVIKEAEEELEFLAPDDKHRLHMGIMMKLGWIYDVLALLKEQEAVEGHWIPIESPTGVEAFGIKEMTVQVVRCSVCDAEEDVSFAAYRFCPRCGAKMKGQ